MGIFDRVLDTEKTHTFNIDDTTYVVNRATVLDARKYVDEHADPTLKGKAAEEERTQLMHEYFAVVVIVSITDKDLADTPENRLMLMTNEAFTQDAARIRDEAYGDSHFKMERDEALKKFSANTSLPSVTGSESTAEKTLALTGT